jgi:plasmid stability protein
MGAYVVAQLIVRNLEESVKAGLRRRARMRGRSLEAEVRDILRAAVVENGEATRTLGSRISNRYKRIGLDRPIPELRGEDARPAVFRE